MKPTYQLKDSNQQYFLPVIKFDISSKTQYLPTGEFKLPILKKASLRRQEAVLMNESV